MNIVELGHCIIRYLSQYEYTRTDFDGKTKAEYII